MDTILEKPAGSELSKSDDKLLSISRHGLESERLADFVQGLNQPPKGLLPDDTLSTGEKLQVLSQSALTGMFSHGYKEVSEHPFRLLAENGRCLCPQSGPEGSGLDQGACSYGGFSGYGHLWSAGCGGGIGIRQNS
ncbi:MAG: hypothetical protein HC888_15455 [Candidatus Competibacteraceae bacterium]|nr:hypothetical protein [Candidatus Competibacteraceae bacterium]